MFQFRGFFDAGLRADPDRRTLVLRALETVEDVNEHLWLTEVLLRDLAALDAEEERPDAQSAKAIG